MMDGSDRKMGMGAIGGWQLASGTYILTHVSLSGKYILFENSQLPVASCRQPAKQFQLFKQLINKYLISA